ncbi:Rieske 2Fe-2S domain-containing protein [Streptomyces sp. adm13(2018)]|uniref:Rieske 2Fe-2S domain-containing protein n=1 Tax=Streptomyces sp. adm13(2018) TaxID=2479007 RepID=UPI002905ECD2|nr:Rieske 2Fe-2S domain-containing protein [Streptomyces sp. adm13(2018)]
MVRAGGKPCAVHRGDQGTLHAVSAVCTHLGCPVAFNNAERTTEPSSRPAAWSGEARAGGG